MIDFIRSIPSNLAADLAATAIIFILGFIGRIVLNSKKHIKSKDAGKRYGSRLETSKIADWVRGYYSSRSPDLLYPIKITDGSRLLAFLSKPEWHYPAIRGPLDIRFDTPLKKSAVPIDDRTLRELEDYISLTNPDGSPWNTPLVTLAGLNGSGTQLQLGWAEYYQYLSTCGKLELETRKAILRGRRTPLRDEKFSSIELITSGALQAQAVGICACVVFKDKRGTLQVLLQRRKENVATYPGAYAVVPMFGCQPVQHDPPHGISLKHDLLREFGEELFSIPELNYPTTHLRHDWFYSFPPIQELLAIEEKGELHLITLGFGFDGLNGELDVAMLYLFESDEFFQAHGTDMRGNWEIRNIGTSALFSSEVDQIISGNQCHPGSAFTIDLSRKYLRNLRKRSRRMQ